MQDEGKRSRNINALFRNYAYIFVTYIIAIMYT